MQQINHKIEEGQHAAHSITEVHNFDEDQDVNDRGIEGDGFYFWDETEAEAVGPHATLEVAVKARDAYYLLFAENSPLTKSEGRLIEYKGRRYRIAMACCLIAENEGKGKNFDSCLLHSAKIIVPSLPNVNGYVPRPHQYDAAPGFLTVDGLENPTFDGVMEHLVKSIRGTAEAYHKMLNAQEQEAAQEAAEAAEKAAAKTKGVQS
jgi:hypothetical protein